MQKGQRRSWIGRTIEVLHIILSRIHLIGIALLRLMAAPPQHAWQACIDRNATIPLIRAVARLDDGGIARDMLIHPGDRRIVLRIPPAHIRHAIERKSLWLDATRWRRDQRPLLRVLQAYLCAREEEN